MRFRSRVLLRIAVPMALLLLSGCSAECSHVTPAFHVEPGAVTLSVGQRQGFDFQFIDNSGTHALSGTWSVSPASGASVDSVGYFVATKPGHYVVTATEGSNSAQADIDVVATASAAATGGPEAKAAVPVAAQSVFNNWNGLAVHGGGRSPVVVLKTPVRVTLVQDYHWNDAHGKTPGTISLKSSDGTVYGPWNTTGVAGQGGVPNAEWDAKPDVVVPAGSYTVIDSDPASWAQDGATNGLGFVAITGVPQ